MQDFMRTSTLCKFEKAWMKNNSKYKFSKIEKSVEPETVQNLSTV